MSEQTEHLLSPDFHESGADAKARLAESEGAEIRARIQIWAGGPEEARRWYRSQPISAFGDCTPKSIVKSGQTAALLAYLDWIALCGFA